MTACVDNVVISVTAGAMQDQFSINILQIQCPDATAAAIRKLGIDWLQQITESLVHVI